MELDELLELCKTDPFGIAKEVDKYLELKEYGREQTMDVTAIENAIKYVSLLEMHSTGLKDCIALEGLLESKTIRIPQETLLLDRVRKYMGQATEELTQWAYSDIGILAFERGMYKAAKEAFKIAAELAEQDQALNCYAGLACHLAKDLAGASLFYRRAMKNGKLPAASNNLGILQIEVGNVPDALNKLEEAFQLCPEDTDILFNLGLFCEKNGRPRDAIKYFELLYGILPERPEIKYFLANEYRKIGNIEAARKYGMEFIAQDLKK